jgi:DNA-binding IclR family transcriptional regulator
LAHAPDHVRAQVLANLVRITPYTITSPELLDAQLQRIRSEHVATAAEEMSLGACSLATPVVAESTGEVVAAIGVVTPSLKRSRQRIVSVLQMASRGIGRLV